MDKKIKHIFLKKIAELAFKMTTKGRREVSREGRYQPVKPSRKSKKKVIFHEFFSNDKNGF